MAKIRRIFDLLDLYRGKYASKLDAFGFKSDNVWNTISASEYTTLVDHFSKGLLVLGLKKGDTVATIMYNSPEWNIIDMSLLQIGAIQIPIYSNISKAKYKYIFNDGKVKYVFVSNSDLHQRILPATEGVKSIKGIFSVKKIIMVQYWEKIFDLGIEIKDEVLNKAKESISPNDTATIIYTSGTTGKPKGVILSHYNIISNFTACAKFPRYSKSGKALSILPICHVYERMLNYLYQYDGLSIYYAENLDNIGQTIREVKPDIFCAVPRILEKIYSRIYLNGLQLGPFKQLLFKWALKLAKSYTVDYRKRLFYSIKLFIARRLVFDKWKKALGGNVQQIICGGASLQTQITKIFWAAGIPIIEGYGLTETSPVLTVQTFEPDGFMFNTVGKPIDGVEIKIAEDGEILCKGPSVMKAYLNQAELTKNTFEGDWFKTGDVGELVEDGFLRITDRKKEVFKTSGGKYVAPQVVENKLKESPFIENIMVIGEDKKFTSAIVHPNFEHLKSWCTIKKIPFSTNENILNNPLVKNRIQKEIEELNTSLDHIEQVKKFELISDSWNVESGELSPTLKLRRKFILKKHEDLVAKIYE